MSFDLVLRNAVLDGARVAIGIADGSIAAIAPAIDAEGPSIDVAGCLVCPGFVDTHIHLDKALLLDRCPCEHGTLGEALALTSAAKRAFTVDDVYARAKRVLEMAIVQGTTAMRTHVEVDPGIGLRGFDGVHAAVAEMSWGIDVQLCVFPQEGLHDNPGTEDLLRAALGRGATAVGAVPYIDRDPARQIATIFELARAYDVDIDMHLDFFDHAHGMQLAEVCRQTDLHGWGGRVTVGHVTALAWCDPATQTALANRLAASGVAVTVLPATDQYLQGTMIAAHVLHETGVRCAIATNNVQNAFTPFGDASLLRMANLYANLARTGAERHLRAAFDMITSGPAAQLRLRDHTIAVGHRADLIVLDAPSPERAVAGIAPALVGIKRGRVSFTRERPVLAAPARQEVSA